ncbi:alpha/beta fold hydrolase [Nocardia brasiliensis]|uniref:alpha/beta fold hydrolase n=1 Tax=Nocardia brasiliensis TaxID=37326 RepID=UPI0024560E83|nr:alpha/beta hydrolase [Nocardia brasiliensis]
MTDFDAKGAQMSTAISADGTRLAYDVVGEGPALVYVTGATCFRKFRPVVDDVKAFSKEFTVYTYDRRGRGDSTDTAPYEVQREVDDIEAMIDAAGGNAFVYGHSSGAVLTLEAALRLPHKVDRAVIYDASYVHDAAERDSYAELARKVESLLQRGENSGAVKEFLREIGMPRPFVALLPLFPGWSTMKALAPTLTYDIALTADVPPLDRLGGIKVPLHIVAGAKSPAGLHDVARQLADTIPTSTLRILEGQNHMVSTKALLPILRGFLRAQ